MAENSGKPENRIGKITRALFSKLTPKEGFWVCFALTAIVLLCFLCTVGGRSIINALGYIVFIGGVLYLGYKLWLYVSTYATAKPKEKYVKVEHTEPPIYTDEDVFTEEPTGEEDTPAEEIESSEEIPTEEAGGNAENTHQISMDELEEEKK